MREWWERRSGPSQALFGLLALVVALGLLLRVLVRVTGGPRAQGPESSSFATSQPGLAAWAELLRADGHQVVRLRSPLSGDKLAANRGDEGTLVVLDSDLDTAQRFALEDFVRRGGRLIIGGESMLENLGDILGGAQAYPVTSDLDPSALVDASALRNATGAATLARRIRLAGSSRISRVSPLRRVATTASGNGIVVLAPPVDNTTVDNTTVDNTTVDNTTVDAPGRVLVVADASFLQNRLIGEADNAALALSLVGPGSVTFAEFGHGYGEQSGLLGGTVLPHGWSAFLAGLVLAFGLWAASVGRRIGPPQAAHRELAPPRVRYIDALATQLQRAERNRPVESTGSRPKEPAA